MRIVWDEAKKLHNPIEHDRVTFEEAATALDDPYALVADDGSAESEQRFKLLGKSSSGRLLVVVYSYRDEPESIRIISSWKAAAPARSRYEQQR